MSLLAVIQAREGGTRLPRKIYADIGGASMLAQVVHRVSLVGVPFVIAFPPPDLREEDVLGRFVRIARKNPEVDSFVRITADCPLWDVGVGYHALGLYGQGGYDFVGTSPDMDGNDVEVFSRTALLTADLHAKGVLNREHVTRWIRKNLGALEFSMIDRFGPMRWSVDTQGDLDFVRNVYAACVNCKRGVRRHTNAGSSIGGTDRRLRIDLHFMHDGQLEPCDASDLLIARCGGTPYVSA